MIRARTSSSIHSKFSLKNLVGMGSRKQVQCFSLETVFLRRLMEGNEKETISFDGGRCGVAMSLFGRDLAMSDLMFVILLWKNRANSSHLVGGRRE